ncbi:MAG: site-specific integrase, partial [Planctomycetes bacterium]|nr:site-specific integrase [Planctomycetota bacterium]
WAPYGDKAGRAPDVHALRHSFITDLARAGTHPSTARDLARHSTIARTMDRHTHSSGRAVTMVVAAAQDLRSSGALCLSPRPAAGAFPPRRSPACCRLRGAARARRL